MATCLNVQKDVLNCSLTSLLNTGLIIVLANSKIQTSFRTHYSFIYLGGKRKFPLIFPSGNFSHWMSTTPNLPPAKPTDCWKTLKPEAKGDHRMPLS